MLDYKKTEDMERMKAEAVKRLSLAKCYPCCLLENMKVSGLWMRKILKNLIHRYM